GQRAVDVRVVYHDRGNASWRLLYHAVDGVTTGVTVANRGGNEWKELTVSLLDGRFANGCERKSDLVLEHLSGGDALFHMIEVIRK
ncbi:MAG: hypothetical protein ACOY3P_11525, partial [Planctomycetota bacterium]